MDVIFTWGVSPHYGWGVIGINWLLHWPNSENEPGAAICAMSYMKGQLASGDPRFPLLEKRIAESRKFQASIQRHPSLGLKADRPVFLGMGNSLQHPVVAHGKHLTGTPTIACPVFEDEFQVRERIHALRHYDLVVAASAWNRDVLIAAGGVPAERVKLCHQGVDLALFNPSQRGRVPRTDGGRFRVFSGGKCEYRKGQDLALQAFARFAEKRDDAVLVACWGSPWSNLAMGFADSPVGSPPGAEIGMPNFSAWAQENGIKPHQIEVVPKGMPNCLMPAVYGGCDVGLFASRAEGATNLMAMECLACGVPAIVTEVTGHVDLPAARWSCLPNVDSIVAALGIAYDHAALLEPADMSYWDWPVRLSEMKALVEGVL